MSHFLMMMELEKSHSNYDSWRFRWEKLIVALRLDAKKSAKLVTEVTGLTWKIIKQEYPFDSWLWFCRVSSSASVNVRCA